MVIGGLRGRAGRPAEAGGGLRVPSLRSRARARQPRRRRRRRRGQQSTAARRWADIVANGRSLTFSLGVGAGGLSQHRQVPATGANAVPCVPTTGAASAPVPSPKCVKRGGGVPLGKMRWRCSRARAHVVPCLRWVRWGLTGRRWRLMLGPCSAGGLGQQHQRRGRRWGSVLCSAGRPG